jgi:hypothetical protein
MDMPFPKKRDDGLSIAIITLFLCNINNNTKEIHIINMQQMYNMFHTMISGGGNWAILLSNHLSYCQSTNLGIQRICVTIDICTD